MPHTLTFASSPSTPRYSSASPLSSRHSGDAYWVAGMIWLAALAAVRAGISHGPGQQRPTFRSSTEIVLIDTQVVARNGTPIQGMKADQFEVFINGRRRPVVSAQFLTAAGPAPVVAGQAAPSGAPVRDGRIIVLGIDQGSFPPSARAAAREAATRVVDRVAAEDYLGMIAFPGAIEIAPTRDRSRVREGIGDISGLRVEAMSSRFNLSATDAVLLKSRESVTTKEIIDRECKSVFQDPMCPQQVIQDGSTIADTLEQQAVLTIAGLDGVLEAMASLPGRKTLMLISAGLPMSNRPGGRLSLDGETTRIARRAAAGNVNLYVFYMNIHFLRYFSPEYGKRNSSIFDDIAMFGNGLEKFADSGGGTFFQVEVDSDPFVERALRETSASYLLAVRVEEDEHDGKDHLIRVSVKQRGATVRYRRVVMIPR